jgi:phage shock protein PspC (stress-responsive transcriptional regulator)
MGVFLLAQYFDVDVTLVRLGFAAAFLIPGVGGLALLTYIVLAIVVPQRPLGELEPVVAGGTFDSRHAKEVVGFILVGLGALALAGTMGLNHLIDGRYVFPVVLIGIGAALLLRRRV